MYFYLLLQLLVTVTVEGFSGDQPVYGTPQLRDYYGRQQYYSPPTTYNQGYSYSAGLREAAGSTSSAANSDEAVDNAEKTAMMPLNAVMSSLPGRTEDIPNYWQSVMQNYYPTTASHAASRGSCGGKNCSEAAEDKKAGSTAESPTSCCCESCWIYAGYPRYHSKGNKQSGWDYQPYRPPYQTYGSTYQPYGSSYHTYGSPYQMYGSPYHTRQSYYPQTGGRTYWLPWWRPPQQTYQQAGSYQINPYSNRMYYSGRS